MLQPALAFLHEAFDLPRRPATLLLGGIALAGSFWCVWFSKDLVALDTLDFWVGTVFIFVLAAVQIVCFGWVWGIEKAWEEAHVGAQIRIPRVFKFVMKYVSPAYLLVVFVGFCTQALPGYLKGLEESDVARWTLLVVLAVAAFLVFATRVGSRRWRDAGLDIDGARAEKEEAA